jgi:hypothetical protein
MASILRFDQWQSTSGSNYNPVVQYVDYRLPSTSDGYTTIADGTYYNTGISVTITPKFATSKLVIRTQAQCRFVAALGITGQIKRDGNFISGGSVNLNSLYFMYKGDTVNHHTQVVCDMSVIAGSTSATTFTMFVAPYGGTGEHATGWGNNFIQIWEIAQ